MSQQPEKENDGQQPEEAKQPELLDTDGGMTPEAAKKKREKTIMVIMIVLAAVMSLAAAVCLLYNRWVQKPSLPPAIDAPDPAASLLPGETPTPAEEDDSSLQPKVSGERRSADIYTILVVGVDQVSSSTDTMMLVTYDVTNQQATVMSLPRDTLVNVRSGSVYTRLNSVYALYGRGEKGVEALMREVSELVGFTPDFHVFVDWELVGEMVDAIGGVWYDVPYRMYYKDPAQGLYIDVEKGYQLLDGDLAMQVVRWRKNNMGVSSGGGTGSDLNRLQVQQGFLKAVLRQTLQIQNVTRIGQLAELFNSRVESELTLENMIWFASLAVFGGLVADDVEFITMPIYGYGDYVYPNQSGLLELINEKLNPYTDQVTINELDLIRVNGDGSLSSSTGVLADPRAAAPRQ